MITPHTLALIDPMPLVLRRVVPIVKSDADRWIEAEFLELHEQRKSIAAPVAPLAPPPATTTAPMVWAQHAPDKDDAGWCQGTPLEPGFYWSYHQSKPSVRKWDGHRWYKAHLSGYMNEVFVRGCYWYGTPVEPRAIS